MLERTRSFVHRLDEAHRGKRPGQPELDARISSYELAARLQLTATDALDVSRESEATREMYGLNDELTASYGRRCLMARRLVERGVRFVQVYIEGARWDHHTGIEKDCGSSVARPISLWVLCWGTLSSAACSRALWSSGVASSAAFRSLSS